MTRLRKLSVFFCENESRRYGTKKRPQPKLKSFLNWRTRRGARMKNSPVEDFSTSGENLFVLESCDSDLKERYKSTDRSELVKAESLNL